MWSDGHYTLYKGMMAVFCVLLFLIFEKKNVTLLLIRDNTLLVVRVIKRK